MGECTVTLQDVGILLGLPINGKRVVCDVNPMPDMTWPQIIGSIFGREPDITRFNGSRIQLSWFAQATTHRLPEDASDDMLRHHIRFYLMQLFGGSLFTDHSGGLIHPMWVYLVRDLDTLGEYAWGPAVLAFLYRELCKGSKVDTEEVAGCLLLLQWLVGHSFLEKAGRNISVTRTVLDELAAPHFIWEPYSTDVIYSLPPYCLAGRDLWRYRGPMICVFIVETHLPDRVARQFGMLQSIPSDPEYSANLHDITLKGNTVIDWVDRHQSSIAIWNTLLDHIFQSDLIVGDDTVPEYRSWYLERTIRFISRVSALHDYLRGGRGRRGSGCAPRSRGCGVVDQVVPPNQVDAENQGEGETVATNLGDDHDHLVDEGGHIDVPEAPTTVAEPLATISEALATVPDTTRQLVLSYPTFDLGLTPTPPPMLQQPPDDATTAQPPPIQHTHRPHHNPISSHPTFDLGITPPSDDGVGVNSSHSTESSLIPLTQASESSTPDKASKSDSADKFRVVYVPRRSKRSRKPPNSGTDGEKCTRQN
ncbi:hypothetical protein POM88_012109 [Heracleum sosnowskyi]|uniref:Aminotransferase-like plant mobile domain-containing protein n=1 Tax=Heracleum sosnowskyi TaxID=360622 RepID=A0AAD8IXF7_9APIA|nr:hypothetical protein POM88_012109 [Heracleum sosnowskyi]